MHDCTYETRQRKCKTCSHSLWALAFNCAGKSHQHLACTVCWADTAQQPAAAIVQAWPLCPRAARQPLQTSRMWRHVQVATSSMGGALKHAHVEARASGDFGHGRSPQGSRLRQHLGGARKPHAVVLMTFTSCSSAYVATLSTSSWTAQPGTHAPSIWISARFVGLRCEHAVCTMRLAFMRYTIGGAEPRAPRPVP